MTEHFSTDKYGEDARKARDRRARELRKQGYQVTCEKWDFQDLARCIDYTLEYSSDNRKELSSMIVCPIKLINGLMIYRREQRHDTSVLPYVVYPDRDNYGGALGEFRRYSEAVKFCQSYNKKGA